MKLTASITLTASLALMLVAISPVRKPGMVSTGIPGAARGRTIEAYRKLPLVFEANSGQSDGEVIFFSRGNGYNIFLTATETVLSNGVRIKLLHSNPAPEVQGLEKATGVSHYLGNDPAKWRTRISRYARVRYRSVYPGVDLLYYGNQQNFEHDFVVAPGADPRQIRFAITGADQVELLVEGDLVVRVADGELLLRKPTVYQGGAHARRQIAGQYRLSAGNEVSLDIGEYDATQPLVIDPVLVYSTYLGGSLAERFPSVVVDSAGNAYVAGSTSSLDFPTANALQPKHGNNAGNNIFVTKLSADGRLVFSTYLGGTSFQGGLIAVDRDGNVYFGYFGSSSTAAADFAVTENAFQRAYGGGTNDVWMGKLSPDGAKLLYGTYLGGSGRDRLLALTVDAQGNAIGVGETMSSDFPTTAAVQSNLRGTSNGFVTQLSADGSKMVYSTYLGGSRDDRAFWVTLDAQGSAYVVGRASSADFPVVNALQKTYGGGPDDGFVAKLSADGKLVFFHFFGWRRR